MLNTAVELPLWLALTLAVGCIYAIVMSVLMPSVRWFFRRRLNRAIEKLNQRLQIQIRPFQRIKGRDNLPGIVVDTGLKQFTGHPFAGCLGFYFLDYLWIVDQPVNQYLTFGALDYFWLSSRPSPRDAE